LSLNRREFLRRVLGASALLVVGVVSSWELLANLSGNAANGANSSTTSGQPPPSTQAASQTATEQQTVTVTQYVSAQSSQQSATSSQTSQVASPTAAPVPAGYLLVAPLSSLAGKTSAYFNHPSGGLSLLLNLAGQWNAFSATCTHAPCTVQYAGSSIHCPCHGANFNPADGAVQSGPAPRPLHQFGVLVRNDNLYVTAA
jgi:Rieske Fe-S protein